MKANELRIGNIVEWIFPNRNNQPNKIEICTIQGIKANSVYVKDSFYGYDQIRPIELTEEWLIKLGFERHEECVYTLYILNDWTNLYYDEIVKYFEISISRHSATIKIIHVHQLQNLYFALTGEELTIKM